MGEVNDRLQKSIGILITGGVLIYALLSIFAHSPFIQQEIVYQAKWWTDGETPFLQNLFNPDHQDYGVGRFRYVEYLSEAAYWKLARLGFIPRDLYDYSALIITALLNLLFWKMGRRRGLSGIGLGILSACLWLTLPTFMVSTWHYRKAKPLASLLLVFLASRLESSKKPWDGWLIATLVIGFFTDPFFILFAPCLLMVIYPKAWKSLITGYSIAFVLLVLINGVIGPQFHPGTKLVLRSIPYKPVNLLNPAQWILFPQVLPQLIGFPRWTDFPTYGIVSVFVMLLAFLGLALRQHASQWKFTLVFLLALPISAVVIHPSFFRQIGTYCSYYGHATFILFLLCVLELLTTAEKTQIFALRWSIGAALILMITTHQLHRSDVFESWTNMHFVDPTMRAKFAKDYEILQAVRKNPELASAIPKLPWLNEPLHLYSDEDGRWPHTSLAYAFIPSVFPHPIH